MKIMRDIQTVSQFKQNAAKLVKQVQETKQPIVLTVNGKPAVVLQDAESFEAMAVKREYDFTIAELKEALADFDNRDNWPLHEEVFNELRRKYPKKGAK
jgi:prevent-host-death family protein